MDAFRKFEFENDERWKAYLKTVEIPAGDSETVMLRVKARFYKRTIDPDFDVSAVVGNAKASQGSSGANPGTTATGSGANNGSNSGTSANARAEPTRPPPPPPPPPTYGASGGRGTAMYGNVRWQRWLFFMHLGMLLLGVFVVVPFLPYSRLANVYFMRLTLVTFGTKIVLTHGKPQLRPLSGLMAWFQRIMPTADFLTALVAVVFSAQPPMLLVAAPPLVLAAYHAAAYAAAHYSGHPLWQRYGSQLHALMLRHQQDALHLNAFCEVLTVFMLVLQLLTPARSFLGLMMYGQILKLKLHMPDSAPQHRLVWRKIDEKTLPYRRHVPAIERLVQMGVNWFSSVPGAR